MDSSLKKVKEFFESNRNSKQEKVTFPDFDNNIDICDFLTYKSGLPYWELTFNNMPYEEMLEEAKALKHLFVLHRKNDPEQEEGTSHKGWSSLCIHGISSKHTMNWDSYPEYRKLGDESLVPYDYTEIQDKAPATVDFLKNQFPHGSYQRVRYMLIPPGGFILPHKDRDRSFLSPVNIALSNPEGCEFVMENKGVVPFKPGKAFLVDISNNHCIWNNSNEDRIHLIIHYRGKNGKHADGWVEKVAENYKPSSQHI